MNAPLAHENATLALSAMQRSSPAWDAVVAAMQVRSAGVTLFVYIPPHTRRTDMAKVGLSKQDFVLGAIWRWSLRHAAPKEVVVMLLSTRAGLGEWAGRQLAYHWESTRAFRDMRAETLRGEGG